MAGFPDGWADRLVLGNLGLGAGLGGGTLDRFQKFERHSCLLHVFNNYCEHSATSGHYCRISEDSSTARLLHCSTNSTLRLSHSAYLIRVLS
jgi:hypothetical protein